MSSTIQSIKIICSYIIGSDLFEKICSIVNEDTLLEICSYEISLGINQNNHKKSIDVLDKIVSYNSLKKYIIERCIKELVYHSKSNIEIHEHFNINFDIESLNYVYKDKIDINIFTNDSLDEFIELFNKLTHENIECDVIDRLTELDIMKNTWLSFDYALRYESIKILKYLLLNCNLKDYDDYVLTNYIFNPMLKTCNHEMIHLILNTGIDFSKISYKRIYNCHHYDFIEWFQLHFGMNDINQMNYTDSLIYHFIYNINEFPTMSFKYDLSCLSITKNDMIYNNCFNIVKSDKYKFSTHDLERAIHCNKFELFKEMINHLKSKEQFNFYVLKASIEYFIINESNEFMKYIIEHLSSDSNSSIILQKDNSNNNIIHLILMTSLESIRIIKNNNYNKNYENELISQYKKLTHDAINYIKDYLKTYSRTNSQITVPENDSQSKSFIIKTNDKYEQLLNEKNDDNVSGKQLLDILSITN